MRRIRRRESRGSVSITNHLGVLPRIQSFIGYFLFLHHHTAHRLHVHLVEHWNWYSRWHETPHHHHVHHSILSLYSISVVAYTLLMVTGVFADIIPGSNTWSFTTPANYTYSGTKIEPNSNNLRLSLQDKIKNFSVAGGQLQSDTIIDTMADSTYYYVLTNTGIDVIRQDTQARVGYIIASNNFFNSITVSNGYLYASKLGSGIWKWQVSSVVGNTNLGNAAYSTSSSPALSDPSITRLSSAFIGGKLYLLASSTGYAYLIKDELGTPSVVRATMAGGSYKNTMAALSNDGALYYDMVIPSAQSTIGAILVKYNAINLSADWNGWTAADVDYNIGAVWAPLHGPAPSSLVLTGLLVTSGTSTARAGDNTIYLDTPLGVELIQENRQTPASGTKNSYIASSKGSNLMTGATAQGRYNGLSPANTLDNNLVTYYGTTQIIGPDWLEYDLGSNKTFNMLRQNFWSTTNYTPSAFTFESSTQGTSAPITPSTAWTSWNYGIYPASQAINNNYADFTYTLFVPSVTNPIITEARFASPQTISAVDMQFYTAIEGGKDYKLESSTTQTVSLPISTATSTSTLNNDATNYGPLKSFDRTAATQWISNVATNTAPQSLQLDLGSSQTIAGLAWVNSTSYLTKDFVIEYSSDASAWSSAYSETGNTSQGNRIAFSSPVTGRYVRLRVTQSGSPAIADGVRINEIEPFSSMFEQGTITTLATVTGNTKGANLSTFSPVTTQNIRVKVTSPQTGPLFGIREMKFYQTAFDGGTVTPISSVSGLGINLIGGANTLYDIGFTSTTKRYIRTRYTGFANGNYLTSEMQLYNTAATDFVPSAVMDSAYDATNGRYYIVNNTSSPEDGRIMRVDNIASGTPTVGQTINTTNNVGLPTNEFSSITYVNDNNIMAGTVSNGTSFIGKRYAEDSPTIEPNSAFAPSTAASWLSFTETATKNGGEIYYQISNDNGATYKYWNGTTWATASSTDNNTATVINSHISTFPVGAKQFKWRAYLTGNGTQAVTLTNVGITYNPDVTAPVTNASALQMKRSPSGASVSSGAWSNSSTPYFSWTGGADDSNPGASGIKGYCLYLGQDSTGNPTTTKGLLGTSPVDTNGVCQFAVSGTNIDTAVANYIGTALTTSMSNYYLNVKAIDYSNNIFAGSSTSFPFRFDNTPPNNPSFVTAPSQFVASKDVTLTWSTGGGSSPSDADSGLAGLQYKIGASGVWYGDSHTGAQDASDLLANDGSYSTTAAVDHAALSDGNNVVYFRTWDLAGNISAANVTTVIKLNTASPSSPQNVTASPSTNTTNSFAFNWLPPATFVGPSSALIYCYTVNSLPTINTCTETAPGQTSLAAGPYATQPGENTFYVVAKDEAGNINYATATSTTFSANTSVPGIPINIDIADISVKATSNWKLAVSWEVPSNVGAGIASYRIFRSTNNTSFTQIASTSGTSYVDNSLSTIPYYYKVKACDSASNCGAFSSTVSKLPTGKFTSPASLIGDPVVTAGTRKASIVWATDRPSDSRIRYGIKSGEYFSGEAAMSDQTDSHNVALNNLSAGTTYYYQARWTDEDGNIGTSPELSFTTLPPPTLKEINTTRINLTDATVEFTSKNATKVSISYGKSENFGGIKTLNTSSSESSYSMQLTDLDDGVKYFYKLTSQDAEGTSYESSVFSFTTPARPRITNLQFQPVAGEPTSTQQVNWQTNVPATSLISYGVAGERTTENQVSDLVTDHQMIIRGLADDSEYKLTAESRDGAGNLATSDVQTFRTSLDTRAPKIKDMVIETSIRGTGAEARGQLIVSWKTDEPATSQVAYAEGSDASVFNSKTTEDGALSTEHIVIVSNLSTSRVYSIKAVSHDKANNVGTGKPQSAIIGRASDSVLTIIINALQKIFGL